MKNLSLAVRVFALALCTLVTQSCEEADAPHGHYHGGGYDDRPRYVPDHEYSEGGYRRPDGYNRREGYNEEEEEDEDRQPSIAVPVPGY